MTESEHHTIRDMLCIFIVLITFGIYLIFEELSKINRNLGNVELDENLFIDRLLGFNF